MGAVTFHATTEVAIMDQKLADAHAEWDILKAQTRNKAKADAGTRG